MLCGVCEIFLLLCRGFWLYCVVLRMCRLLSFCPSCSKKWSRGCYTIRCNPACLDPTPYRVVVWKYSSFSHINWGEPEWVSCLVVSSATSGVRLVYDQVENRSAAPRTSQSSPRARRSPAVLRHARSSPIVCLARVPQCRGSVYAAVPHDHSVGWTRDLQFSCVSCLLCTYTQMGVTGHEVLNFSLCHARLNPTVLRCYAIQHCTKGRSQLREVRSTANLYLQTAIARKKGLM